MYETEAQRQAALAERRATIQRAINLLKRSDPGMVTWLLSQTTVKDSFRTDPAKLVAYFQQALRPGASTGCRFGSWKIAQQLCRAAGLRY